MEYIIETYCKEESGVRELRRCLIQIAQKINMLRMYNTKDLPFHIADFSLPFVLKKDHIKLFLNKREEKDKPPQGMYV
jgi:ATP-dependent Lon protease